jgi:biotin carboxylase
VFLKFDEETERLSKQLGADVWFPKAKLRQSMDNKITTVQIGNEAGVPSAPNELAEVKSYEDQTATCEAAGIGHDLVLQSAFGDSGHTTFFIKSEADFRQHEHEIIGEGEIKIMKRIDCRGSAIEACATKEGAIVSPLMTELVGFSQLTPYRGGWCGNEILSAAFPPKVRQQAREPIFKFGEQLRKEGYRRYFELDFLIDRKTGDLWLGELNPRITVASLMTNHATLAHADAPLFLFHLLEFSKKKFHLDVEELNNRQADPSMIDSWSQMIIKHTDDSVDICTAAPDTGIYKMLADGRVVVDRFDYHRRAVEPENEGFFCAS